MAEDDHFEAVRNWERGKPFLGLLWPLVRAPPKNARAGGGDPALAGGETRRSATILEIGDARWKRRFIIDLDLQVAAEEMGVRQLRKRRRNWGPTSPVRPTR
jgi:hypothetical protein